jgi:hypothetical protein
MAGKFLPRCACPAARRRTIADTAGAQLKSRTQEMLAKTYELQFEEDGGLVHSVPASLVVERP